MSSLERSGESDLQCNWWTSFQVKKSKHNKKGPSRFYCGITFLDEGVECGSVSDVHKHSLWGNQASSALAAAAFISCCWRMRASWMACWCACISLALWSERVGENKSFVNAINEGQLWEPITSRKCTNLFVAFLGSFPESLPGFCCAWLQDFDVLGLLPPHADAVLWGLAGIAWDQRIYVICSSSSRRPWVSQGQRHLFHRCGLDSRKRGRGHCSIQPRWGCAPVGARQSIEPGFGAGFGFGGACRFTLRRNMPPRPVCSCLFRSLSACNGRGGQAVSGAPPNTDLLFQFLVLLGDLACVVVEALQHIADVAHVWTRNLCEKQVQMKCGRFEGRKFWPCWPSKKGMSSNNTVSSGSSPPLNGATYRPFSGCGHPTAWISPQRRRVQSG